MKPNRFNVSMYRMLLILAPPTRRAKSIQSIEIVVVFLQIRFQADKEITPVNCGSSPCTLGIIFQFHEVLDKASLLWVSFTQQDCRIAGQANRHMSSSSLLISPVKERSGHYAVNLTSCWNKCPSFRSASPQTHACQSGTRHSARSPMDCCKRSEISSSSTAKHGSNVQAQ